MKTLDKVIKANECCDHGEPDSICEDCPYNGIGACCAERETDALHYLKEYKQTRQDLLDGMKRLEGKELMYIHALANLEENPPLTWDELRQMVGKPVWVVEEGNQIWEYWSLVYLTKDDELTLLNNEYGQTTFSKNEQGTVWQAYRKER